MIGGNVTPSGVTIFCIIAQHTCPSSHLVFDNGHISKSTHFPLSPVDVLQNSKNHSISKILKEKVI